MLNSKSNKIIGNYAIVFSILIFILSIVYFSICNRISIDDMFFYSRCRDIGIKNMVIEQYNNYSGRYTAYYLNGFVLSKFNSIGLIFWNCTSIFIFFIAIMQLFKKIEFLQLTNGAGWIFIFSALFFGCTHTGEEFMWHTQVNTYLWSTIFAIITISIIISQSISILNWILLIFASFFIGGSSESIAYQFFIILFIFLIVKWKTLANKIKIASGLSIFILLITAFISISAPGNAIRSSIIENSNSATFAHGILTSFYHYYFSSHSYEKYLWTFTFLFVGSFAFKNVENSASILKLTLFYFIFVLLLLLPTAWALREPAPARSLLPLDIITLIYLILVIQKIKLVLNFSQNFKKIAGFLLLITAISYYSIQSINYSIAYDKRDENLKTAQTLTNQIITELPNSRIHKVANISIDSSHFSNQHVKMYYQLK